MKVYFSFKLPKLMDIIVSWSNSWFSPNRNPIDFNFDEAAREDEVSLTNVASFFGTNSDEFDFADDFFKGYDDDDSIMSYDDDAWIDDIPRNYGKYELELETPFQAMENMFGKDVTSCIVATTRDLLFIPRTTESFYRAKHFTNATCFRLNYYVWEEAKMSQCYWSVQDAIYENACNRELTVATHVAKIIQKYIATSLCFVTTFGDENDVGWVKQLWQKNHAEFFKDDAMTPFSFDLSCRNLLSGNLDYPYVKDPPKYIERLYEYLCCAFRLYGVAFDTELEMGEILASKFTINVVPDSAPCFVYITPSKRDKGGFM